MVLSRSIVGSVLAWIGGCIIVVMVLNAVLACGAENWLCEEPKLIHADAIVVLGGESGQRMIGAAGLYHADAVPRMFVSGQSDCLLIECHPVIAGVSAEHIGHECVSDSTMENARTARETLVGQQVQSVILVTSWYHTGRALAVFRRT